MKYEYRIEPDHLITLDSADDLISVYQEDGTVGVGIAELNCLINEHKGLIGQRYKILGNAYKNQYPILNQQNKARYKPDNRLTINFAKYIVDTLNGFFIGNPIKVSSDEEDVNNWMQMLDAYNDQDDNNAELAKLSSIYGKAYELYYTDQLGNLRMVYLSPEEGFMVYDRTVEQNPLFFISWHRNADGVMHGEIRDSANIYTFTDKGGLKITEVTPHYFDGIPVVEYIENDERMSVFESSYSSICEYMKVLSEKANDVDYFSDAYLKILGTKLETSDLKELRENRIINLEGEMSDKVEVEFLNKPNSDTSQENLLNRLERLIFQISMVANISDENFGNASGIALRYKLHAMQTLTKTKERKFQSGLNQRYRLLFSHPGCRLPEDAWMKVKATFTYNFPANLEEEVNNARNIEGIVSKKTQLELLSFVDDAQAEMDRMEQDDIQAVRMSVDSVYEDEEFHSHE